MGARRELLIDAASGTKRPTILQPPELDSAACNWPAVLVEQHHVGALEIQPSSPVNHVFAVHLEGVNDLEVADDGPFRLHRIHPGQVSFFPAGSIFASRTLNGGRFYTVSVTPQFMANHALTPDSAPPPRFLPQRGIRDDLIKVLCDRIRDEVTSAHPRSQQYVETLAQALAAHATRYFSATYENSAQNPGSLSSNQLRKSLTYMEEHLAEELPLPAIARAAGLSPFHFARRFKNATGLAPHQYLIHQRVKRARHLLISTSASIAEVAAQCGFCDQSHLTNHFRRVLNMTPRRFRERFSS